MFARGFVLLAALGVAGAGVLAAQEPLLPSVPQSLSLAEALDLAETYSPVYRQTLNDRSPAAWGVRNAYASFLPSLNASSSASYSGAGSQRFLTAEFVQPSATIGSNYSLTLNWQLNGNTLMAPGVQNAALNAADANIDAAQMNVRAAVVQQYLLVLQARAQVEIQERQVVRNEENLRLARARYEVGQTTMLDVRQAEVAKGQSDVALLQARQAVTVEKLRLFQNLGVPAPDDPALVSLSDTFPIVEPTWSLEELLRTAEEQNPNVLNLLAQENQARWNERAVKSQWLPTLSFAAGWAGFTQQFTNGDFLVQRAQQDAADNRQACDIQNIIHQDVNSRNPGALPLLPCNQFVVTPQDSLDLLAGNEVFPFSFTQQPFSARLTISLPIFDQFNRNLQIAQASAQSDDAAEFRRARELQVRTDVSQQYYGLLVAYQTIEIQQNNRVAAQEQLRLARERYRVGAGTFFELLDAQLVAQQAEADYVNAVYAYHRSIANLEAAVGRQLR